MSILLLCLFLGLISVFLPEDRCGEWISGLLIVVMFLFVTNGLSDFNWDFPEWKETVPEGETVFPEREALHRSVGLSVYELCGRYPTSVESDLSREEDRYLLRQISVVIAVGDPEEVKYELERSYPDAEIRVRKEEGGSG